ncbi:Hypothetical predicted protein [Pelobates cultripes]|uniref:Uncharacterized protein n=1 Tax=Pelobates cultripes TaxID=61616 RepID=A0AAD1SEJ5_PELCU|nr:Hypothetical predicted protein [Pelobates cultripes]
MGDTLHILTKLTEVRNFLANEIYNSTKEVKAEIQAALEDKMVQVIRAHNTEAVMKYARNKELTYQDAAINLYQDLSPTTLQRRRNWRPLALLLQEKEIRYTGATYTLLPGADPKKFLRSIQVEPPPGFTLTQETLPELNTLPAEWTTTKDTAGRHI